MLTRRRFLVGAAGALGAATLGDAFLMEPAMVELGRHDVPVPNLPSALDGVRIACVTDVHLTLKVPAAARRTLEHLARERPEVVVLAGDICNRRSHLPTLTTWTRDARGTLATFATYGNWEHYAHVNRVTLEAAYDKAGVEFLYNATGKVRVDGATLTFVGLDDPVEGRPNLPAALAGVGADETTVWLLHAPGYVDTLPRHTSPAPTLILAGHTHGGQIRLPFYTPVLPRGSGRFVSGWYRDTPGPLYVSRGIGTVLLPARLFCPPELPIFTLRRA
jgi:predicted MPP superfamily phosphohydrolase